MSSINGDKSRSHIARKKKLQRRKRTKALREELANRANSEAKSAK
jgi:hypothetical protein